MPRELHRKTNVPKASSLTSRQRRLFFAFTLFIPVIFFIFIEIALRISQYGSDLDLVKTTVKNGGEYYYINPSVGKRFFDPEQYFVPHISSGYFAVEKKANTFRMFVLGESTPAGFPYQYNTTPTRILQKQLEILFPEKIIEIVNVGLTATNSFTVLEFIEELIDYQPDAFLVYSGQNEFYGAFGVASTNSIAHERWVVRMYQKLRKLKSFLLFEQSLSALSRMVFSSSSSAYSGTLMQQLANDKAISFHSSIYSTAMSSYTENLSQSVSIALDHHIPIILSSLVTNEGGLPPFVSLHEKSLSDEQRKEIESKMSEGTKLFKEKQYSKAIDRFRDILSNDSTWAIAQFAMGQCYEFTGLFDSARIAYGKARDFDGLRFRASSEANTIIRRISAKQNIVIAEVESTIRANSPNAIIGNSLLWEHVHPRFAGYVLLSKAWLKATLHSAPFKDLAHDGTELEVNDSVLTDRLKITSLDLEIGDITMNRLLRRWPFTNDPYTEVIPQNNVQKVAQQFVEGKLRWNEAHFEMADEYLKNHDIANAIHEYESVIAMDPSDPFPSMRIGDLYFAVKEYELSAKAFRQSLVLQENSLINLKLGILYLKTESYEEAKEFLRKSIDGKDHSLKPLTIEQKDEARFYMAVTLYKMNMTDDAVKVLSMMIAQDPNNSRAERLLEEIKNFKKTTK